MTRFQKFIAAAALALVVFGILVAVNPHCAHACEGLWSCHAGPPAPPRQMVAPDPWVLPLCLALLLLAL